MPRGNGSFFQLDRESGSVRYPSAGAAQPSIPPPRFSLWKLSWAEKRMRKGKKKRKSQRKTRLLIDDLKLPADWIEWSMIRQCFVPPSRPTTVLRFTYGRLRSRENQTLALRSTLMNGWLLLMRSWSSSFDSWESFHYQQHGLVLEFRFRPRFQFRSGLTEAAISGCFLP